MQAIRGCSEYGNTTASDPGLNRAKSSTADAKTAEARLKSTKGGRVRLRCLAARALCGFLTAAALLALALPAQAQIAVWSSSLTVKNLGDNNALGCAIYAVNGSCSSYLSNNTFTHYGRTYEFLIVALQPNGDLLVGFNGDLASTTQDLTLNVDGAAFAFEDADETDASSKKWNDSGLSWTTGETVSLTLTDFGKPAIPAAPAIGATRGSNTSLDVGWLVPTNAGPFVNYDIQYSPCAEEEEVCSAFASGPQNITTTFATIGNLDSGTIYQVRVRATNPRGTRGWSRPGTGQTTSGNTPGAPTSLAATKNGDSRIDLSWTAPSNTGDSPIRSYHIEVQSAASNWLVLVTTTGKTDTDYSHRGVPAGVLRRYRVSAINTEGTGPPSNVDEATTDSASGGGGGTQMQQSQTPLAASFVSVPGAHDGETAFWLELSFDSPVAQGSRPRLRDLLGVTGGSETKFRRKNGQLDHWQIRIEPSSQNAVTVTLSPSPPCGQTGAVCTDDGRTFTTALATQIHGPASGNNNWSDDSAGTTVTPVPALPLAGSGVLGLLLAVLASRRQLNNRRHLDASRER